MAYPHIIALARSRLPTIDNVFQAGLPVLDGWTRHCPTPAVLTHSSPANYINHAFLATEPILDRKLNITIVVTVVSSGSQLYRQ